MVRRTSIFILLLQTLYGVNGGADDFNLRVPKPLSKTHISAWDVYLPTGAEATESCQVALEYLEDELWGDKVTGAYELVDSWGASDSGMLMGFADFLGTYDECKRSRYHDNEIHGKYCRVSLLNSIPGDKAFTRSRALPRIPWVPAEVQGQIDDKLNRPMANNTPVVYGTCIPDACSQNDLEVSLTENLNSTDFVVLSVDCHLDYRYDSFSAGDIAFVALLGVFAFLLLSASILDIYIQKTKRKDLAKGGLQYLLPFSAYTNIQKLFHMNTERTPGMINCLHAMRVISMTWVIYGHQQATTVFHSSNFYRVVVDKLQGLYNQALLNAYPSVDTFFFMSGFLMAYNVLKEFKKTKRFNLPLFYFHRLLRLIPPIALVCGLYATIPLYFMDGPMSFSWWFWRRNCREGWWRDVLFISNFAETFNGEKLCLGQVWYLAADSQLYLVAPLVLLPLLYWREIGMVWLYLLTMASMIIPGVLVYIHDLPPFNLIVAGPNGDDYMYYIYEMPWCRAGPVLIGIWLGVFLHDQGNKRIKMKPWQVLVGWTLAIASGLMVVFGMFSYNVFPLKAEYDVMTRVFYSATERPVWAAALAWVVFACYNGYGGFIDDFLSHPIWQPMSRLTFAVYLVAMPLQNIIVDQARNPYYFCSYSKVFETVGAIIVSVIPSVLVSLTVESPIIGIEKLIFRRPSGGKDVQKKKEMEGVDNKAFEDTKELEHVDVNKEEKEPKEVLTSNL